MSKARRTLRVAQRRVTDLTGYERNARKHSKAQVEQIVASIKEFGFTNPILIDEDGVVIAGHGRLEAAVKMGLDKVPTITLSGLTEQQKRAYVLADNKLALNAQWDSMLLAEELEALSLADFDLQLVGFNEVEQRRWMGGGDSGRYTMKVESPIYEPTGEKPEPGELYDTSRTDELVAEINKAKRLPEEVREFLLAAATRHTVFNFARIAEFYAHAPKQTQRLMERSALVIIDFDKAIEEGFVRLTDRIGKVYQEDTGRA